MGSDILIALIAGASSILGSSAGVFASSLPVQNTQ
jgi:hypothetical protein